MGRVKATLFEELTGAGIAPEDAEKAADVIAERGYRRERNAAWVRDKEYASKNHVRWRCTDCGHWQSAKRHDVSEQIFYMNYCPFCGAKMKKPQRKEDKQ